MNLITRVSLLCLLPLYTYANPAWDGAAWSTASPGEAQVPELEAATAAARASSDGQLYEQAASSAEFVSYGRPPIEWTAWRMAHLYRLSGEVADAEKAAAILGGLASRQTPVPPAPIHTEGQWIPYPAVIAYALVKDAPVWPVKNADGEILAIRDDVEDWLWDYADSFAEILQRPGQVTNYTPYGLRHAASLALVLNDASLMQLCLEVADRLAYSPEFWHADLMWQEGSVSYGTQVTGNLKALLPMLRAGGDAGLIEDPDNELDRLSERLQRINEVLADFSMPSGHPITVNDTHWTVPVDAYPRAPKVIVFPDFGHFAVPGPDMETHLSVPTLTGGGRYGGGHYHDSRLSLQLWAHGEELLPDAGYPFRPANNRYFHMSPYAHNTSIVVADNASYGKGPHGVWGGQWARSAILGFDDGTSSSGLITYVAAASPGPEAEQATLCERALIQVATGQWTGYVVDAFWLQGGTLHRSFLRQSEDEPVDQEVSVPLTPSGKDNLAEVLKDQGKGSSWTEMLGNPKRVQSDKSFNITWTGEDSQVALDLYLAPQPGSTSWLSQMPRLRPTNQDASKKNDFPGWHLMRQRAVSPEQVTLWGALYEPVDAGQSSLIQHVEWKRTDDGAGILVRVTLPNRIDTWILGLPGADVTIDGYHLSGRAAGVSQSGGSILWTWAAAGSQLTKGGVLLAGGESASAFGVQSLTAGAEGQWLLTVDGKMPQPPEGWAALRFSDGSAHAVRLTGTEPPEAQTTTFVLTADPGMAIDAQGMQRTAFPLLSIPGETTLVPLGGTFTANPH
ncbi:heparinase II/III family protein [Ruficoccus amylovorans]|uniref:Heparinase II/III family protein n=1 Tax=Ruficoccus amylovorans TaxID=1804625 RepID=A0A842HK96_9BACT|nr:heparinase II/III family protein [Ruficoccus amylovorans]MBC2595966.1 heparinase II/III family protein [Ruficoccus amylovorans]